MLCEGLFHVSLYYPSSSRMYGIPIFGLFWCCLTIPQHSFGWDNIYMRWSLYRGPSTIALPFPEEVFIELMGIATK